MTTSTLDWNIFAAVATTVLYEGHVLYPYRPSALKNQQQWNFGTLFPPAWGAEPSAIRLEVLIESDPPPSPLVRLCFLRDGIEQYVDRGLTELGAICCELEWEVALVAPRLWKLTVNAANRTDAAPGQERGAMLELALHSAHLRCALEMGQFVSAQDPGAWREAAEACHSQGVYPVLIGAPGERRYLLAAPIILEDHPQIAPQSQGDFCDACEMDELLTLRVMTLTEAEKAEARAAGGVAQRIVERCEASGTVADLHGGLRSWGDAFAAPPATVCIGGCETGVGARVRVRLAEAGRRDIFEQALDGRTGVVQAIEQDLEGGVQIAIVADDDPGRDLGELRQTGHRFFFAPNELEPL